MVRQPKVASREGRPNRQTIQQGTGRNQKANKQAKSRKTKQRSETHQELDTRYKDAVSQRWGEHTQMKALFTQIF